MTFNCQGVHVWQFSLQNWQQELIKKGQIDRKRECIRDGSVTNSYPEALQIWQAKLLSKIQLICSLLGTVSY